MKNIFQVFKQAQKLQTRLSKVQDELAKKEFTAESGAGMIRVRVNGRMEVQEIIIDPEMAADADLEMLSDLIAAAINETLRRVQEYTAEEMKKISGGLPIPDIF